MGSDGRDDPFDFSDSEGDGRRDQSSPEPDRTTPSAEVSDASSRGEHLEPLAFRAGRPQILDETDIPKADVEFHTGIIGATGSGKTYLFQALVHRLETPGRYGVLTRYLTRDGIRLYASSKAGNKGTLQPLRKFNEEYQSWRRLPQNRFDEVYYYHLFIDYKTGLFGQRETSMKVSFLDCSGEHFQTWDADPESTSRRSWKTFEQARVMVFCLPLWAVFPNHRMQASDWVERQKHISNFRAVTGNYRQLRQQLKVQGQRIPKCRFVVALTQADDRRCALGTLSERWIHAYIENHQHQLKRLSGVAGPTKYLAGARSVSDYVRKEFEVVADETVASILPELEIDGNQPWLIPVTAIDGTVLDRKPGVPAPAKHPVPAHVELLLLLGLCEAHNALM